MPSGPDEMDVAASPSSASPRKSKTKKKKSEPVNLPMPGMLEDLEAPLNPKRARDNASPTLTPTSRGPKPKKARKSLGKGNGESAATPSSTGRKARKSKKEKRKSLKERMERSLIASPKRRDSTVPSSQPPSAMKMEGVEHAADPASSRSEPVQNGDGMVPDSDPTDLPMSQTTPNKVLVPESEDDEEQKASKALGGILDKLREQKEENVAFSEMVRQSKPLEKRAREKRMKKKMEAARERRKKLDEARDEIVPTTSFLTEAEVADSDTEVWLFRMPDNKAVTDKVIGKKISFRERDGQLVEKLSVKIKGNQHLNLGSTSAFGDGSAIAIPCAAGDGSRKLVSVKPTHYASLEYAAPYDPNEKAPPPSPLIYAKEPQGLGPQFPLPGVTPIFAPVRAPREEVLKVPDTGKKSQGDTDELMAPKEKAAAPSKNVIDDSEDDSTCEEEEETQGGEVQQDKENGAAVKEAEESESDEDSESEDEKPGMTQKMVPASQSKDDSAVAPSKHAAENDSGESDDSESEDELPAMTQKLAETQSKKVSANWRPENDAENDASGSVDSDDSSEDDDGEPGMTQKLEPATQPNEEPANGRPEIATGNDAIGSDDSDYSSEDDGEPGMTQKSEPATQAKEEAGSARPETAAQNGSDGTSYYSAENGYEDEDEKKAVVKVEKKDDREGSEDEVEGTEKKEEDKGEEEQEESSASESEDEEKVDAMKVEKEVKEKNASKGPSEANEVFVNEDGEIVMKSAEEDRGAVENASDESSESDESGDD